MIPKFRIRNKMFLRLFVYIYTFFVIYMPRLSDFFYGIQIEVFSVILLIFTSMLWIIKCKNKYSLWKINKNILWLFIGIFISAVYFAGRAFTEGQDVRLMQNLFIIIQIMHILIIVDLMKYLNLTRDEMMRTLFNLALLQGLITIIMILFPSTKEIALSLYYLDREENVFISRMRIYGISGDYTFFTPIYHGMLAGITIFYSVNRTKKYLFYLPLMLLVTFMNGRFGILIFLLAPITLVVYSVIKGKVNIKVFKIILYTILLVIVSVFIISAVAPYTYKWIVLGITEVTDLLIYGEKTGNVNALLGDMFYFPKEIGLFFGYGHRIIGNYGRESGFSPSDIGYVNDMFMGGLLYVSVLYGSIISFLLWNSKKKITYSINDYFLSDIISKYLLVALLTANFKGEVMRGGLVLLGAVFIKLILIKSRDFKTK